MIWGTVITTMFSNLLVPGIYVFRELQIDLRHVLDANAQCPDVPERLALVAATWALAQRHAGHLPGNVPLVAFVAARPAPLTVGTLAYAGGYLLTHGRPG